MPALIMTTVVTEDCCSIDSKQALAAVVAVVKANKLGIAGRRTLTGTLKRRHRMDPPYVIVGPDGGVGVPLGEWLRMHNRYDLAGTFPALGDPTIPLVKWDPANNEPEDARESSSSSETYEDDSAQEADNG